MILHFVKPTQKCSKWDVYIKKNNIEVTSLVQPFFFGCNCFRSVVLPKTLTNIFCELWDSKFAFSNFVFYLGSKIKKNYSPQNNIFSWFIFCIFWYPQNHLGWKSGNWKQFRNDWYRFVFTFSLYIVFFQSSSPQLFW